jgi:S-adenosylhomocysteine hydrolase
VNQYEIPTFAIKGEDHATFFKHILTALEHKPHLIMEDGGAVISSLFFIEMGRFENLSLILRVGRKDSRMPNEVSY